jgi:hypothetical protein
METLFPWTVVPLGVEERHSLRRREVRASLEERVREAQMTIDGDIAPEIERLQYEREIVRRLIAKAQDDEARKDWEIEESVLHDVGVMRLADLEEQQERIARYEAMLLEIDEEEAATGSG